MDIQQIIEAARTGDERAKAQFIVYILQKIRPQMYRYYRGTNLEPEDLLQEISVMLLRYWDAMMAADSPAGYGMVTAKHVLINALSKVIRRRDIAPMISLDSLQIAL